jgi:hypothetical protein
VRERLSKLKQEYYAFSGDSVSLCKLDLSKSNHFLKADINDLNPMSTDRVLSFLSSSSISPSSLSTFTSSVISSLSKATAQNGSWAIALEPLLWPSSSVQSLSTSKAELTPVIEIDESEETNIDNQNESKHGIIDIEQVDNDDTMGTQAASSSKTAVLLSSSYADSFSSEFDIQLQFDAARASFSIQCNLVPSSSASSLRNDAHFHSFSPSSSPSVARVNRLISMLHSIYQCVQQRDVNVNDANSDINHPDESLMLKQLVRKVCWCIMSVSFD